MIIKVIGAIVLIIGLIAGISMVTTGNYSFKGRAQVLDHNVYPKKPLITNITENSMTISYFTPIKAVKTQVSYGKNGTMEYVAYDDRGDDYNKPRYTHYVTLKGLDPGTEYFVRIDETGPEPFLEYTYIKQKTLSPIKGAQKSITFTGTVHPKYEKTVNEGIIYLNVHNGQYMSASLGKDGKFSIPLGGYRTDDLGSYHELRNEVPTDLMAVTGLQGYAFHYTTVEGSKKPADIYLENYRVPFSKVQLGEEPSDQNWFQIVWGYIKNFFNIGG